MATISPAANFQRPLIILASLAIVIGGLYFAQKVIVPVVMAVLLGFILSPLVAGLQRYGLRRTWAVALVVVLLFTVLAVISYVFTMQFQSLAAEVPKHKEAITAKITALQGTGEGAFGQLFRTVREISDEVQKAKQPVSEAAPPDSRVVVANKKGGTAMLSVTGLALPLLEGLATAFLVVVLVIFMLIMREELRNRVLSLIGHGRLTNTTKALDEAAQRISSFLLMQAVINVSFGVLLTLGLLLIGVPYALLWGLLAALFRFIPYLGTWVAIMLPVTFCVAIFPGWWQPLLALGVCVALELATANVLEPLILGHSTGISPLALLVAAVFWTWLWGPIGLIVSTPLTTCLVVLGKYVPDLKFLNVLLGNERALDTNISYYQRLLARDQDEAEDLVEEYLGTHSGEELCDNVFVPALVFGSVDQLRGDLTDQDHEFIVEGTRQLLDDVPSPSSPPEEASSETSGQRPKAVIFGCPAHNEADELGLLMLQKLLEPSGCQVEVLSSDVLSAEVVSRVEKDKPALVCIGSLPPGSLAQVRYLSKRLRARFPDLKILVGRWGQKENIEKTQKRLQGAGADYVGMTLAESRSQVLALVPTLKTANSPPKTKQPAKQQNALV